MQEHIPVTLSGNHESPIGHITIFNDLVLDELAHGEGYELLVNITIMKPRRIVGFNLLPKTKFPAHPDSFTDRITDLDAQVQFAVDYMQVKGLLDEGCFTFPDGTTVYATGREPR